MSEILDDFNDFNPQNNNDYGAENLVYASFWRRLAALLIDGVIITFPLRLLRYAVGNSIAEQIVISLFFIVVRWLYFALQEGGIQQATIGKRAMRIKVTNMQGEAISFGQATGRYFAKIISAIILLIGYFMAAFTEKNQALHDMIAGTLVVEDED